MASVGEPEVDYNVVIPIWERLGLPFGPKQHDSTFLDTVDNEFDDDDKDTSTSDGKYWVKILFVKLMME